MAHLEQLDTTARHRALTPEATIFVAASAGSGKTKVLTDRLLRLLGEGVPPSAILCLTFTKAAALEMRERLMAALKDMAVKDELTLFRTLQDLFGRPPQSHELTRARLLFTQVLDTPGGLQLMTLHSFCQQLLQRFPIEAGLTPGFRVMDESEAQTLLLQAMDHALTAPDVAAHLGVLAQRFSPNSLQELIINAINTTPNELGLTLDDFPHAAPDVTTDADVPTLHQCILALRQGSEADSALSRGMNTFWQAPDATAFAAYAELFLTQKGEVRARLVSKKLQDTVPDILQVLQREADRVQHLLGALKDYRAGQVSRSLSALVRCIAEEFDHLKRKHNCVNYDDLIRLSLHLLRRSDLADWVRFKLDRRLAHLLVDEAQDTSALQWQLVGALAEEFYTGDSQTETPKSLFLVGDLKQSIYGFQGAAPELFKAMGQHYTRAAQEAGQGAHIIELTHSFRSSPAVLLAVDAVFAQPHMAHHVQALPHLPMREGHAGTVELWPLIEADHEWEASSRLAKDLAKELRQWFQEGRQLPARGRPVTPGDVLILVQRRQGFIGQLTR
ncbi:MAG: UvrD-helicase domain-containing protein, partial [Holosporales bacterium]